MKSAKRIKYFSSISQGQNHIPPPRFQSVHYCLTPLIHLLIIFPSLFYQVRFRGAFHLKFHTHFSPSEKVKISCSFAAVSSIFSPFFSFSVAFWNWASFSIASRVNKTIPLFFLKILLSIAKTILYFSGRICPKILTRASPLELTEKK